MTALSNVQTSALADSRRVAPGRPGSEARWTCSEKTGIGTAIAETSRVWFSTARGIVTEVFFPLPDSACVRTLGFVVTDDVGFVSSEETDADHDHLEIAGVSPISRIRNRCRHGRYQLEKETICDPLANALLQRVRFVPKKDKDASPATALRLFCFLETHLGEKGDEGAAEIIEQKGRTLLVARGPSGVAIALACSIPWRAKSVGFVGPSDGRSDLAHHGHLAHTYASADKGNVCLTAELDLRVSADDFTIAVGFGTTTDEAAHAALGALTRGYDPARSLFVKEWDAWSEALSRCTIDGKEPALWQRSTSVLKTLEAKRAHGGRVAGLATPWGASKGPGIDGTYHLVWTRDLVESLGALVAAGACSEAEPGLRYLQSTQEEDGHWPQNMNMAGKPFWNNDELDETALPIVFLHLVRGKKIVSEDALKASWRMTLAAVRFLALHGPSTKRDRWEDVEGVTPFTIATEIVALLIAADMAEKGDLPIGARYLRDLADEWNAEIDSLLYRQGGALAEHVGVDGYYVRVRKPGDAFEALDLEKLPKIEISPDALALVRFGLRAADDPRIMSTVKVIDAILKTELTAGPCWRRYPRDEYGEHADGAPFDGHGMGRPWPLFTGERGHYEVAAGNLDRARALLKTMEYFANASGMLPEQVWDAADIRDRGLFRGQPSGSAAPLGWAHGEYIKLCRSIADGAVFDLPRHAYERYVKTSTESSLITWRRGELSRELPRGKTLRVALESAGVVEHSRDGGTSFASIATIDTGIGIFFADIPACDGDRIVVRVRNDGEDKGNLVEVVFTCPS